MPKSLSELLIFRGFDPVHTLDLASGNSTSDKEIIRIAIHEERVVITKDNDFLESFLLNSQPEKSIIVRTGNISNSSLLKLFDDNLDVIKLMLSRSNLIEITRDEIAEHV